jgi:ABC-type amino acid transport substrate-binding protein
MGAAMMRSHHLSFACVLLLAVFLAGMVTTAQGQSEPTLDVLRSGARSLVVGGVAEFAPFNFVGPDGQLTGMDRDIVRAAAKRLGIKQVEFKTMTFSELGPSLLDGKIDLIANNYWPTPEREHLYAFTMPYFVRGGVGSLWLAGYWPVRQHGQHGRQVYRGACKAMMLSAANDYWRQYHS